MIKLKFYGLGGQGVVTASKILSTAVSLHEGRYAITVPSYGYERRGAPVNTSIVVDENPVLVNCFVYEPDIVVVFDASIIDKNVNISEGIHKDSVLVLNTEKASVLEKYSKFGFKEIYYADGTEIAHEVTGVAVPNGSMMGVLAKTGVVGIESAQKAVEEVFGKKVGELNAKAARKAYEATKKM